MQVSFVPDFKPPAQLFMKLKIGGPPPTHTHRRKKGTKMVISLVLVEDFNVFIWIKVDGTVNDGYLVMKTNLLSLSMRRSCPLDA